MKILQENKVFIEKFMHSSFFSCEKNNRKNIRSLENSNKAFTLRRTLYNKFKDDKNLSFFFSDKPADEKTDAEIIYQFSKRNGHP